MRVAVGTTSQAKIKYVADFFNMAGLPVKLSCHQVDSGITEQPIGQPEIIKGAVTRARAARQQDQAADIGIGLEAGLLENSNGYALACMAVIDNGKQFFKGQSQPLKLPSPVSSQIKSGGHFGKLIRAYKLEQNDTDSEAVDELISRQHSFGEAMNQAFADFLANRPYRIGAIAYVFDEKNNILIDQLVDYSDEDWNFPGGGRNQNETALQTIYRELEEELNLHNNDLELIKQLARPIKYDFPMALLTTAHSSASLFKGQIKAQFIFKFIGDIATIKLDPKELRHYRWVTVPELKKYLTFPNQYEISIDAIKDYIKGADLY
jgi:non-canonical (house-cleaning) NTP pyrophosphatase